MSVAKGITRVPYVFQVAKDVKKMPKMLIHAKPNKSCQKLSKATKTLPIVSQKMPKATLSF